MVPQLRRLFRVNQQTGLFYTPSWPCLIQKKHERNVGVLVAVEGHHLDVPKLTASGKVSYEFFCDLAGLDTLFQSFCCNLVGCL